MTTCSHRTHWQRSARPSTPTGAEFLYSDFANFRADGSCEVYDRRTAGSPTRSRRTVGTTRRCAPFRPTRARCISSSSRRITSASGAARHISVPAATIPRSASPTITISSAEPISPGAKFHYIPECLYLYRLLPDGQNTYLQRNAEIQLKQQEVSNRYVYDLIAEWAKRSGLPMLDLGGATGCPAGYKSVDLRNADIVCDIRYGLPLPDSSVACIRAYDFLEHVPTCRDSTCDHGADGKSPKCVVGLMNEIYRVLAPGGWLVSRTPSTDGRGALSGPDARVVLEPELLLVLHPCGTGEVRARESGAASRERASGRRSRPNGTRPTTSCTCTPTSSRSRASGSRASARSERAPEKPRRACRSASARAVTASEPAPSTAPASPAPGSRRTRRPPSCSCRWS